MERNDYQSKAMTTCMPSSNNFAYMLFGLLGEIGEMVEKVAQVSEDEDLNNLKHLLLYYGAVAKKIRKEPNHLVAQKHSSINIITEKLSKYKDFQSEFGDIEWMLNGIYTVLGWTSDDVAQQNLDKLASRKERGVIDGNGDNR